MTNFWKGGMSIKVKVDASRRPTHVLWHGKYHGVERVGRIRVVDDCWWTFARIWRVYYRVTTDCGLLIVIFCDVLTNNWYLERLYD
jgi:hypothetical protein